MLLNENLVYALGVSLSHVVFHCEEPVKKEAEDYFTAEFKLAWEKRVRAVREQYGEMPGTGYAKPAGISGKGAEDAGAEDAGAEDAGVPFTVTGTEDGFLAAFDSLVIPYPYGDYYEWDNDAVQEVLAKMDERYPQVSYEGCIAFPCADLNGREVVQYEVSSGGKREDAALTPEKENGFSEPGNDTGTGIYAYIGNLISFLLDYDEEVWERLENVLEDEYDFRDILADFRVYGKWVPEDAAEKLKDLADKKEVDIFAEEESE